ncbi:MAG: cytochrome c [Planctomycetes bacterium]|nr:cytochrome c [Planctomycetota bacterium]
MPRCRRPVALALLVAGLLTGCPDDDLDAFTRPQQPPVRTQRQQPAPDGAELFVVNCASCHGEDARGVPGLGKDLTTSEFVDALSIDEMLAFLKEGRAADHPLNDTGVTMPPKGGNPALSDEQLRAIAEHVQALPEAP